MNVKTGLRILAVIWLAASLAAGAQTRVLNHSQALAALKQSSPDKRLAGVARLADIGAMADADALVDRLRDTDARIRSLASIAMWQIWSRSGDKEIDALYQRGVTEMEAWQFDEAVATFSEVIQKKPEFAEAWNKRATTYFLMNEFELSLKDCNEVMIRNPNHYAALSGMGQIYLNLGDPERSLAHFEKALAINPNLLTAALAIRQIQQHLQEKKQNTI